MKSRLRVAVVVIAATLLVGAIAVFATTGRSGTTVTGAGPTPGSYTIKVTLNTRQTVPRARGTIRATGSFTGTLKVVSASKSTLTYGLTYARLTGPALAAHVHLGAAGKAGKIVVPLCAPCRSGAHATKAVSAVAAQAMIAGKAYVNVHTKKNPAGEIRGQVKATSAGGGGASANPYANVVVAATPALVAQGKTLSTQLQLRGLPHARRPKSDRAYLEGSCRPDGPSDERQDREGDGRLPDLGDRAAGRGDRRRLFVRDHDDGDREHLAGPGQGARRIHQVGEVADELSVLAENARRPSKRRPRRRIRAGRPVRRRPHGRRTGARRTPAKASLHVVRLKPLTVRGSGFKPKEKVVLRLSGAGAGIARGAANAIGSVTLTFPKVAVTTCTAYVLRASGAGGTTATLKNTVGAACRPIASIDFGASVIVTGSHFQPGERLTVTLIADGTRTRTVAASAKGLLNV